MKERKRQTWDEVKRLKETFRMEGLLPRYQNSLLMAKAIVVAEQILKWEFVLSVGLFGSTARGEDGNDIDLLIIDDGTVSKKVLDDLKRRVNSEGFGFTSGGAMAHAGYLVFARHMPGKGLAEKLRHPLYEFIREPPMAIDLIFVHLGILYNQQYLDELIINGNDPFFFRNIENDTLLFFVSERRFRKSSTFPHFVNNGIPSPDALRLIGWVENPKPKKEKLVHLLPGIEARIHRGATEGEKQAARCAWERIVGRPYKG